MLRRSWRPFRVLAVATLVFSIPSVVLGQTEHVVGPMELQKAEQDATNARQKNLEALQGFLDSPEARESMQKTHMDPVQVRNAIAGLSDQELAQLASRATKVQNKFAAGDMSKEDWLISLGIFAFVSLFIVVVNHD